MKFYLKNFNVYNQEDKRMKCKTCGKELIGTEKSFCQSCGLKKKDQRKKRNNILATVGIFFVALGSLVVKKVIKS